MRAWRAISFFWFLIAIPVMGAAQSTSPQGQAPPAASNVSSQSVRIVSPQSGQKIRDNFIDVRFEVINPGVSVNTPTFNVQLDGRDPVQTTSTDQTFDGLTPGSHTLTVELVDANGTPINGSRAQVQFIVTPQQAAPTSPAPGPQGNQPQPGPQLLTISLNQGSSNAGQQAQTQQPQTMSSNANKGADKNDDALPQSGSALPLLSLIGFGVLLGGITSALKTR